ncbi:hypothetical protein C2845_PM11G23700 [Panicum miliaceum]|uniref:Uncharacterized protein n=1 Tax=Panicum miliaceum TaxID=4540 RepID=A0A3L6RW58_PANMI|nr:hypothetical protein C2845_PM11G23700 [Panicum miliaceum]
MRPLALLCSLLYLQLLAIPPACSSSREAPASYAAASRQGQPPAAAYARNATVYGVSAALCPGSVKCYTASLEFVSVNQ